MLVLPPPGSNEGFGWDPVFEHEIVLVVTGIPGGQLDSCQDGLTIEADPHSTGEKPVVGTTVPAVAGGEKLPQHARKRRKSVTAGGERLGRGIVGNVGRDGTLVDWEDSRVGWRGLVSFIGGLRNRIWGGLD